MGHSLQFFETLYFLFKKISLTCFFFSSRFCVFFPTNSLMLLTHSFENFVFFFPDRGKKKRVFYTLTRIFPKSPKKQTIPGEKEKTVPLRVHFYSFSVFERKNN